MNKVLIVIDAQEDFTRGSLKNDNAIGALSVIHDVVEYAAENNMTIAYTADTHGEDYFYTQEGKNLPVQHCNYRTPGWNICPEVINVDYPTEVIMKETFGYSRWDVCNIASRLSTADEIWMCGFCTDICVMANFQILKAFFPEIPIVIISDGCAGVTPELHQAALKVMCSCQGKILTFDELKRMNEN